MELGIMINRRMLDGVTGDLKLTVTSADPYTMSQPTRGYSGTITVPRSANNDQIFKGMRHFGMMPRDYLTETVLLSGNEVTKVLNGYTAQVFIGNVQIPGDFRAKVTCKETGYDIALSQTTVTAEQLPSRILSHADIRGAGVGGAYNVDLNRVIADSFNTPGLDVNFPNSAGNMQPIVRTTYETKPMTDFYVGQAISLAFRFAMNTDAGTRYLNNDIDIMEYAVRDPASFPTLGSYDTLFCDLSIPREVILDVSSLAGTPVSLVVRDKTHKQAVISLSPVGSLTDKTHIRYTINTVSPRIRISGTTPYTGMYLTTLTSATALGVHPPEDIESEAAFRIPLKITGVSGGGNVTINGGLGTESARELLDGFCKAMMWTYEFSITSAGKVNLNIRDLLHADITTAGSRKGINGTTLQDWSEFYVSTEKIEDSSGFANSINGKIGEKNVWYTVTHGMFTTRAEVFTAELPYKMDQTLPRAMFFNTSTSVVMDYFSSHDYLYNTFRKYYDLFKSGIDVTIKANIPFLRFKKQYRPDGAIWLDAFKSWFYIRSVSEYSVATGDCKIKLTKLNI